MSIIPPYSFTENPYDSTPERLLLAAMLERAIRDLKNGCKDDLISSLKWFSKRRDNKHCLTYIFVCETLHLSARQTGEIGRLIEEGKARLEQMRGIIGRERKRRGLCIAEDKYLRRSKNGMAVVRFRRSRVSAHSSSE